MSTDGAAAAEFQSLKNQVRVAMESNAQKDRELADLKSKCTDIFSRLPGNSYAQFPVQPQPMVADGQVNNQLRAELYQAINSITALEEKYSAADTNFRNIHNSLDDLFMRIDAFDQYLKFNNLLIHGLHDIPVNSTLYPGEKITPLEFCEYIANKLNELLPNLDTKITPNNINDAHRLRTRKNTSNVVIVRFVQRGIRKEVFKKKKFLKNKAIAITEHLTSRNMTLLNCAKRAVGRNNAWSFEGRICINAQGKIRNIKYESDLDYYVPSRSTRREVYPHRSFNGSKSNTPQNPDGEVAETELTNSHLLNTSSKTTNGEDVFPPAEQAQT